MRSVESLRQLVVRRRGFRATIVPGDKLFQIDFETAFQKFVGDAAVAVDEGHAVSPCGLVLLEPIGNIPLAEAEARFYADNQGLAMVA